jgi:hypothetical protein
LQVNAKLQTTFIQQGQMPCFDGNCGMCFSAGVERPRRFCFFTEWPACEETCAVFVFHVSVSVQVLFL